MSNVYFIFNFSLLIFFLNFLFLYFLLRNNYGNNFIQFVFLRFLFWKFIWLIELKIVLSILIPFNYCCAYLVTYYSDKNACNYYSDDVVKFILNWLTNSLSCIRLFYLKSFIFKMFNYIFGNFLNIVAESFVPHVLDFYLGKLLIIICWAIFRFDSYYTRIWKVKKYIFTINYLFWLWIIKIKLFKICAYFDFRNFDSNVLKR